MAEQGYYGTEDRPLAELHSERVVLTPHTSGEPDERGLRLRTDLNSGDRIATVLVNNGTVGESPVFPDGTSTPSGIAEGPPVYVPGEGWGFIPIREQGGAFEEYVIWHDSTRYGLHDILGVIPDSEANQKLIHRWILDDVGTGTAEDSEGNADGSVNGVSSTSGDWSGGSAGEGDGTGDYIDTTSWGSFGSSMSGPFAIAGTIQTTGTGAILGLISDETDQVFFVHNTTSFDPSNTSGPLKISLGGPENSLTNTLGTDTSVDDGGTYRFVINSPTGDPLDGSFWLNQSDVATSTYRDDADLSDSSYEDFSGAVPLFARWSQGSRDIYWDGVIDDLCIFNDVLTDTEIQSYNNPWD